MSRKLLVLSLVFLFLLVTKSVHSLSCAKPHFLRDAEWADLVILGEVEKKEEGLLHVEIDEILKGIDKRKKILIHVASWTKWSRHLYESIPEEKQLVFALGRSQHPDQKGEYLISLCAYGPLLVSPNNMIEIEIKPYEEIALISIEELKDLMVKKEINKEPER